MHVRYWTRTIALDVIIQFWPRTTRIIIWIYSRLVPGALPITSYDGQRPSNPKIQEYVKSHVSIKEYMCIIKWPQVLKEIQHNCAYFLLVMLCKLYVKNNLTKSCYISDQRLM